MNTIKRRTFLKGALAGSVITVAAGKGLLQPTEVLAAWTAGVAAVKAFPASIAGPELVKALRGPFEAIPLVPTGGITAENAAAFLSVGAVAVGLGGWLTGHSDPGVIAERAALTIQACRP